ncbi:P1 family peptidase [Clostridium sediminicola]|uniref:DmpA family aminopeptidase n=1 Tax=Clostridium sediminicola TaxID=3114879 RepID=UPI0031F23BB1
MSKQLRIVDYGIKIGFLKPGKFNKITDVKGVTVGHSTIDTTEYKTGVTVINPLGNNIFTNKLIASSCVLNGYGKTVGLIQLNELGQLESPIALTNTLNVGIVQDALVQYMVSKSLSEGIDIKSINTVVAECNDSYLSNIVNRPVKDEHVLRAFEAATIDFQEGDIGGGKGMSCHQLKGGIGSSSRVIDLDGIEYTIGVLVQSNYGLLRDLRIDGNNIGHAILEELKLKSETDKGSIIVVVATDLPLSSRQMQRVCKRTSVGMARVGSFIGHGSGEIIIGFSTGNVLKQDTSKSASDNYNNSILELKIMNEDKIDVAFRAVAEATEEAILNSMITANEVVGYRGNKRMSLKSYMHLMVK